MVFISSEISIGSACDTVYQLKILVVTESTCTRSANTTKSDVKIGRELQTLVCPSCYLFSDVKIGRELQRVWQLHQPNDEEIMHYLSARLALRLQANVVYKCLVNY